MLTLVFLYCRSLFVVPNYPDIKLKPLVNNIREMHASSQYPDIQIPPQRPSL